MQTDPEKSALFYTRLAPQYDVLMEQHGGNGWVRGAFRQTVRETVPTGELLLDFGCGTGTDTLWYVAQGYRVLAYDNAPGMMEQLQHKCRPEIAAGVVIPLLGDYKDFPQLLQRGAKPGAIVANFAVLNQMVDIETLFALFAGNIGPSGWIVVSVLNPFFWQDALHRMWWEPYLCSFKARCVTWKDAEATHYRHYISRIVRAASPHFVQIGQVGMGTFLRFETGQYIWGNPRSLGEKLDTHFGNRMPLRHLGKFIFLIFQRTGSPHG